jgi:hypothetical protein
MFDLKSGWQSVTDREKWAARRASFVAKLKATKVVWSTPQPAETGKKAAAAAGKATKRASKKATSSAKKTTSTAKKTTGAAKKAKSPAAAKTA